MFMPVSAFPTMLVMVVIGMRIMVMIVIVSVMLVAMLIMVVIVLVVMICCRWVAHGIALSGCCSLCIIQLDTLYSTESQGEREDRPSGINRSRACAWVDQNAAGTTALSC